jgi:hypothetical protein
LSSKGSHPKNEYSVKKKNFFLKNRKFIIDLLGEMDNITCLIGLPERRRRGGAGGFNDPVCGALEVGNDSQERTCVFQGWEEIAVRRMAG